MVDDSETVKLDIFFFFLAICKRMKLLCRGGAGWFGVCPDER